MPSKFDLLREGQAVEIKPGVKARLNRENKTLELSTGEILNASNDPDFFPSNEQALQVSRQKEQIERGMGKGALGEFAYQFGQQGLVGGASDWVSYLTQTGEQYANRKRAEQEVSQRISEESPYLSAGATVASFVPDVALTRGLSARYAAPLLTTAHAGSRLATEPGDVLGEAALSAGVGFGLDKTMGYLNRVAQRRGLSREIPKQQELVNAQNIAGKQATEAANLQQRQQFSAFQQQVKNENAARLHQHNLELNARQNRMTEAQNAYEQAKTARDAEVLNLKNQAELAKAQRSAEASRLDSEYKAAKASAEAETRRLNDEFKLAQSQYQQSLKELPKLQRQAQEEYSKNVIRNVGEIEKQFPKNARIVTDQLGTNEFIQQSINSTGLAGSREGAQASRILKTLFPEGELLTARELSKKYQAIEEAIQRATPEVQSVLNQFKQHMGKRLPAVLEDTIAFSKIMPSLEKNLEKDITSILNDLPLVASKRSAFQNIAKTNLKNALREISPDQFVQKLQSGELKEFLKDRILTADDMLSHLGMDTARLQKQGLLDIIKKQNAIDSQHAFFVNEIAKKIENRLARSEIKVMQASKEASKKLGKDVKKTYGMAEPIAPPAPPVPPEPIAMPSAPAEPPPIPPFQMPPPISPPQAPPIPPKPSLMAEPTAPIPQQFNPQPLPTLPAAQGSAEKLGDFLEKDLLGGKGIVNNPIAKLAGLKYLAGKAAIPIEAGYMGLKGLTAPGAGGEVARMTFKQAGIQAIDQMARKYPSYHNGILESPQERRSLTKEIEDDSEIPLEQKALIQSKINRGKPIFERLQ